MNEDLITIFGSGELKKLAILCAKRFSKLLNNYCKY